MKIYVDFDRTLFDCDKFLEDFYALIDKYNIPKALFKECQNQSRRKGFNPYIILNNLEKKENFDKKIYQDIDSLIHRTSDYLYPDAIPFLEYLKSMNYEIIILTKGNSDYQREKIFNSHLDSYYNKLIVTMKHKGKLDIDYQNGIFIDDNPIEIQSIMNKNPKKIIRIQRDNSKYGDMTINIDINCAKSLDEIIKKRLISI